jgi:hypothetical protein
MRSKARHGRNGCKATAGLSKPGPSIVRYAKGGRAALVRESGGRYLLVYRYRNRAGLPPVLIGSVNFVRGRSGWLHHRARFSTRPDPRGDNCVANIGHGPGERRSLPGMNCRWVGHKAGYDWGRTSGDIAGRVNRPHQDHFKVRDG